MASVRSRREQLAWLGCLAALPFLFALALVVTGRLSIEDYLSSSEIRLRTASADGAADYADMRWRLQSVRLIGDGKDPRLALPADRRLVVVRLAAKPSQAVSNGWEICRLTLADSEGRRWQPLNFILSGDLSRIIDPGAEPPEGCDATGRNALQAGKEVVMEEKFLVPSSALGSLSARLSLLSERPDALSFPLKLE